LSRRFGWSCLFLATIAWTAVAQAQSSPAKIEPAKPGDTPRMSSNINLGDSVVALNGPWRFHVGDSPIDPVTQEPVWAEPGFDDSTWETVDLTPKNGSLDPISGLSGFVAGWTGRGHPGYWGFAWYRIRVRVNAKPGVKLALAGSSDVDDVYQLYDGGRLVGGFGDFSTARPRVYYTQPTMFDLPESQTSGAEGPTQVLAFRFWMEPNTLQQGDDVGGFHTAPLLGELSAITARYQMRWLELIRAYLLSPVQAIGFGVLGLVAFSLMLFDRSDKVYLWIGMLLLVCSTQYAMLAIGSWTQWFSAVSMVILQDVVIIPLVYTGWVMVWRVWFRLRRPTWLPSALLVMVLLLMASNALGDNVFFTVVPQPVSLFGRMLSIAVRLALASLMLTNIIEGIRQQGLEGWVVLPAVLLAAISGFAVELRLLHVRTQFFIFGTTVSSLQIANLLLVAALAILLLRRLQVSIRTQRLMALDVHQAQEVQQVILPEGRTMLPGLVIESEYRPAREVGGDFFQIIPNRSDDSLLIVAGDVTGKGLKAGMLVALLVGAIRSTAELNSDPEFVLKALNRRLLGRGDAQATCMAVRISADGEVKIANAGHIPPYLNGDLAAMEGAVPLGMLPVADLSLLRLKLKDGDQLVLVSDGIVEATNADGQLFGFDRVRTLLHTAKSATEVASVAQSFGQEDDISVISVTRTVARQAALA
jgi:hypothetical protein